ncbi:MAG: hypothetical protein ACXABI_02905 [Candidatus Hodarchaeales archaeon]
MTDKEVFKMKSTENSEVNDDTYQELEDAESKIIRKIQRSEEMKVYEDQSIIWKGNFSEKFNHGTL